MPNCACRLCQCPGCHKPVVKSSPGEQPNHYAVMAYMLARVGDAAVIHYSCEECRIDVLIWQPGRMQPALHRQEVVRGKITGVIEGGDVWTNKQFIGRQPDCQPPGAA